MCFAICRIGRRKACRLWSQDHEFYREAGWSSPMYTLYNKLRYNRLQGMGRDGGIFNEDSAGVEFLLLLSINVESD